MCGHLPTTCLLAVLLTAEFATGTRVHAEKQRPARCEASPGCQEILLKAYARSKASQPEEALQLYEAAYHLQPDPRLLYNAGRILHRLGRTTEAAEHYQRVLDSGVEQTEVRQRAQEYLVEIRAKMRAETTRSAPPGPAVASETTFLLTGVASAPNEAAPIRKRPWLWAVIGVGGALVVGGVVTGIIVGRQQDIARTQSDIIHPTWSLQP